MISTAILGCNGYAGQETLDRVLAHPELEVVALGSDSLAGQGASALDLRLNGSLPPFVTNGEALASGAELVFLCLDHAEASAVEPPADTIVVDLSGAHRLLDAASAEDWYGVAPGACKTHFAISEERLPSSTRVGSSKYHSRSTVAPGGTAAGESAAYNTWRSSSSSLFNALDLSIASVHFFSI